jgi:hypothetical protein
MTDSLPSPSANLESKKSKKQFKKRALLSGSIITVVLLIIACLSINIAPFKAMGGVIWLKNGVHYMDSTKIANRIMQINAPIESQLAQEVAKVTPSCDSVDSGYCQQGQDVYAYKTLVSPEVPYKPGTPDKKVIAGYCTLCGDGTFSPSCAVGRGACSWHSGVAEYNAPEYRIIPGTPAVEAQPAVYSYAPKTYKDSTTYISPRAPTLSASVGY